MLKIKGNMLTKSNAWSILEKYFEKGSFIMLLFVIENTYENNVTMQNDMHGLNVVCEYSSYEEK